MRIFLGFDPRETVAYHVFAHSILMRASEPVTIAPVKLTQLKRYYQREPSQLASTEFSFSRFLVPYLCNFKGWALFADCDMLCRDDVAKLWALRDPHYAVQVVKHQHRPYEKHKFLGATQTQYEKKNWSSVMLFNCEQCRRLTPQYINTAPGLQLHQFKWLPDESHIGELPHRWNHLVGYDRYDQDAAFAHFTIGGPYFHEYSDCDYAEEWRREFEAMNYCEQKVKVFHGRSEQSISR